MIVRRRSMPVLLAVCLLAGASVAKAQGLETALMPGQVIKGHAKYEADCRKCHVRFNREAQTGLCLDCHKAIARDVAQRRKFHGRQAGKACRDCHTDHKGRDAKIDPVNASTFDHRQTEFLLRGAHASPKIQCRACHVPGRKFREAPLECFSCHRKDDKHKGRLGTGCADCHTATSWKQTRFNHSKTRFPLRNKHADVPCRKCHADPGFKGAPLACSQCHQKDDRAKGHHGKFGTRCETCHTDKGWRSTIFEHARDAKYPLRGRHATVKCAACHTGMLYRDKLPQACVACHRRDDEKRGHHGKLGTKCERCHNERSWKASSFNHDRDTKYPLRGRHARVQCSACHAGNAFTAKLATECAACHRRNDVHKGQLGARCESCHSEVSWKRARFDHGLTRFPLFGRHAAVKCRSCHASTRYRDARVECYACHAKADRHRLRLGTRCEQCHNARSWKDWEFDHNRRTRFRLDGKHRGLECIACHRYPVRGPAVLPEDCMSCHERDDVHNGGFGRMCDRCHVTSSFKTIKPGVAGRLFE